MKKEYQAPLAQSIEVDVDVIVASSGVIEETAAHDNTYIAFDDLI